jgi:hypothetical protein
MKKCNPNLAKANDPKYECNPATGRWNLKKNKDTKPKNTRPKETKPKSGKFDYMDILPKTAVLQNIGKNRSRVYVARTTAYKFRMSKSGFTDKQKESIANEMYIAELAGKRGIGPRIKESGYLQVPQGEIHVIRMESLQDFPIDKICDADTYKQLFNLYMKLAKLQVSTKDRNVMYHPGKKQFRLVDFSGAKRAKTIQKAKKTNLDTLSKIASKFGSRWKCDTTELLDMIKKEQ